MGAWGILFVLQRALHLFLVLGPEPSWAQLIQSDAVFCLWCGSCMTAQGKMAGHAFSGAFRLGGLDFCTIQVKAAVLVRSPSHELQPTFPPPFSQHRRHIGCHPLASSIHVGR